MKRLSLILSMATLLSSAQAAEFGMIITDMTVTDGVLQSMKISKSEVSDGKGIAAVYDADGRLIKAVISHTDLIGEGEKTVTFPGELTIGEGEKLKGFVWKNDESGNVTIEPMSGMFVWSGAAEETTKPTPTTEVTQSPSPTPTAEAEVTQSPSPTPTAEAEVTQSPSPTPTTEAEVTQSPSPTPAAELIATPAPTGIIEGDGIILFSGRRSERQC